MVNDVKVVVVEGVEVFKKKSKKLLIIILVVVFVLVLGGGGVVFMLMKDLDYVEEDEDVVEEIIKLKKKDKKKDSYVFLVFVNLEVFIVNFVFEIGDQYFQVVLLLELEDVVVDFLLKLLMLKICNNIIFFFLFKKVLEFLFKEGKESLVVVLKVEINGVVELVIKDNKGKVIFFEGFVKFVFFIFFIIQ